MAQLLTPAACFSWAVGSPLALIVVLWALTKVVDSGSNTLYSFFQPQNQDFAVLPIRQERENKQLPLRILVGEGISMYSESSVTISSDDEELAPEETVCGPPEDCATCEKRENCDNFED